MVSKITRKAISSAIILLNDSEGSRKQPPWEGGKDMKGGVHVDPAVSQPPAHLTTHQTHAHLYNRFL